jgi:hypothetical protein
MNSLVTCQSAYSSENKYEFKKSSAKKANKICKNDILKVLFRIIIICLAIFSEFITLDNYWNYTI